MRKKSKMLPPTYFYSMVFLSIILHFLFPITFFIRSPFSYLGIIPIIIGISINIWTDKLFKKKKTTVKPYEDPSSFIIEGPFKFSRPPMYLGMFFILLGFSFLLGSIITLIFPIIFVLSMEIMFIPFEEESMQIKFKNEYSSYKKEVRRWI